MSDADKKQRPIRSFVLRTGRMTPGQEGAYNRHWHRWGLTAEAGPLDFSTQFGRNAKRVIEIGFGMGQSLAQMASAESDTDFVGIEVHRPGVGKLLHSIEQAELENIRVYCHDAVEVFKQCIADASIDRIQIYFPDPWHKKRHHKRRLIQPPFVELLVQKLKPGGVLHLATDWEHYAEQMLEVLSANQHLINTANDGAFSPRPDYRPITKFEQRGQRLGHGVWDLLFERVR